MFIDKEKQWREVEDALPEWVHREDVVTIIRKSWKFGFWWGGIGGFVMGVALGAALVYF